MTIFLFVLVSGCLLAAVEGLKRSALVSTDLARRLAHLGAGAINIAAPVFVPSLAIIIVNLLFLGVLLLGRRSALFSAVQTTTRRSYGDLCFPLGIIVAALLLLPEQQLAYQYGVAIMGVSDALAGLVGERWGKWGVTIFGNRKTVLGSGMFYVSSLLITIALAPTLVPAVFFLPLLLTALELGAVHGTDNLILPVAGGLLFLLLV